MFVRKKGKKFYAIFKKNGKQIWSKGYDTEQEAIDNATKPLSLHNFMEYYIKNIAVKEKTKDAYKYALQSLFRAVGDISIKQITTITLQDWLTNLDASNRTKRDYFNAVRTALKQAKSWQYIDTEPYVGVIVPHAKKSAGKALSYDDVQLLLENAGSLKLPILLGAICGMRISEICGLRVNRIYDDYIQIDAQLQRTSSISSENDIALNVPVRGKTQLVLTTPKTASSCSKIPLPHIVSNEIQNALKNEKRNDKYHTGLLLLQKNGQPYEPSTIRKQFNKLLKKCNLEHYRLHDLRHTTATLMLEHNISPLIVSKQLRHADVNITQNIYQHVSEQLQQNAVNVMDNLFSQNGQGGRLGGNTTKTDIKKTGHGNSVTCMNTDIEIWSGRRDSNSRPLVPETATETAKPHGYWLLVMCGVEWIILSRFNFVHWYWKGGRIGGNF